MAFEDGGARPPVSFESPAFGRRRKVSKRMSDSLMSPRTAELLLLLYDDGVDGEELKALVDSAFQDGLAYMARRHGEGRDSAEF